MGYRPWKMGTGLSFHKWASQSSMMVFFLSSWVSLDTECAELKALAEKYPNYPLTFADDLLHY